MSIGISVEHLEGIMRCAREVTSHHGARPTHETLVSQGRRAVPGAASTDRRRAYAHRYHPVSEGAEASC